MFRNVLVVTLCLLFSHALASNAPAADGGPISARATDLYPKNPRIDVLGYTFRLTLSDNTDEIEGETTVEVRFLADGVTELRLDLANAKGDREGRGMTVASVRDDDGARPYEHDDDVLIIGLRAASVAGERARFTVAYSGEAATGLRIGPNRHGERTFFSDNWPNRARHWLPTVDHPYDKATSEFIVTAPNHYQVISNGLRIEETDLPDGMRLTHWKQSVPISTWLNALGVARFAVQRVGEHRGREIQTWVFAQDRDDGFYDFAVPTKQAMEFYETYVGPFAYEKLANVQAASGGGGMEAATAIFYGEGSVTGERTTRWRNVIIHEVAHQWFGNAVTEYDWDDVWLSEGFASYFTLLFIEHAYGRDEFVAGLKSSAESIWTWYDDNPDYRIVHDNLDDMSRVTSIATYRKGSWVLHMLRGLVGEDAFWAGIQSYYAEHFNGNASTDDFKSAMEDTSGHDLDWFFQRWLYEGGNPTIEGEWRYDPGPGSVIVDLRQVHRVGREYRLPLEIGIYLDGERTPTIHSIELNERAESFSLPVSSEPVKVILDPRTRVLFRGGIEPGP